MLKLKNILISQPEPVDIEKSPYADLVNKYKLNVEFQKFIKIEGVTASEFRKDKVYIQDYTAIIFTSRNAVDHFFRIAKEMRVEIQETMKYFCISEATAFYLQKYVQFRKRKVFNSQQNFDDLLEIIKKNRDDKFLFPCSDIHTLSLTKTLDANKIKYTKAVIYKTVASDLSNVEIDYYDLLVFFSPAGIKSLIKNFPNFKQNSTVIGAFGEATLKAAKDAGLKVEIKAPTATAMSMPTAIDEYIQAYNKRK